jgi:hypothetical protein
VKQWTTVDKTGWGEGAWQSEPDKISWTDAATDLPCLMVRNRAGAWCGYVGVDPSHSYHSVDYADVDINVHGGLTYSGLCDPDATEEEGICHIPEPGKSHDIWWFGFDCLHFQDIGPVYEMFDNQRRAEDPTWPVKPASLRVYESYKTQAYVEAQIAHLAHQLRDEAPLPSRGSGVSEGDGVTTFEDEGS